MQGSTRPILPASLNTLLQRHLCTERVLLNVPPLQAKTQIKWKLV
jgi:hypothetical protein